MPRFKNDTLDWADGMEDVLNEHSEPPRYLTRTLQEYIDGKLGAIPRIFVDDADRE